MQRAYKIIWTPEMIDLLKAKFPNTFNRQLAAELNVSMRSLIRKARELDIEKEEGFLDRNRLVIGKMAHEKRGENPTKGMKGWCVPNGELHRFKPGNIPPNKINPELIEQAATKRNATIKRERLRIKYGLPQQTNLKLNPYSDPVTKYKN